jgi:hypothetical protein
MTENQRLMDVIEGMWPRLALTSESALILFGYASGDSFTPGVFTGFGTDESIDACRAWAVEHRGAYPSSDNGAGWRQIRGLLLARARKAAPQRDQASWGPAEEVAVNERRMQAIQGHRRRGCLLPPDWLDDLEYIRRTTGLNPSGYERQEAEQAMNREVVEANERCKQRGSDLRMPTWPSAWWRMVPQESVAGDWDEYDESNAATMTPLGRRIGEGCTKMCAGRRRDTAGEVTETTVGEVI